MTFWPMGCYLSNFIFLKKKKKGDNNLLDQMLFSSNKLMTILLVFNVVSGYCSRTCQSGLLEREILMVKILGILDKHFFPNWQTSVKKKIHQTAVYGRVYGKINPKIHYAQ